MAGDEKMTRDEKTMTASQNAASLLGKLGRRADRPEPALLSGVNDLNGLVRMQASSALQLSYAEDANRREMIWHRKLPNSTWISLAACLFTSASVVAAVSSESPLSPQQERATFHFADDNLTAEVVTAEPDIVAPVAMAWDAEIGRAHV